MKEIQVTENEQNQRLDKFLLKYFNTASKSFVYKMLRKKRIKYNNKRADGNEMLKNGDTLQMYLAEETMDGFMEERKVIKAEKTFDIIFEDKNIIIASKPSGLLTHAEKPDDKNTLIDQIIFYMYEKGEYIPAKDSSFTPALCNRLDRNTSGAVIAGKNLMALQGINMAIAKRRIGKFYITVVKGEMKNPGSIETFHSKDEESNKVTVSQKINTDDKEKKAVTKYRPIKATGGYTLLEIELMTGKTHQIRAHMEYLGHPIIGDRKYGDEKTNKLFFEKYHMDNQFLHAYRICFDGMEGELTYLNGKEWTCPLYPKDEKMVKAIFGGNTQI